MREWTFVDIESNKQASDMVKLFKEHQPKYGAFDSETDGLHIILSNPFLFQFGWLHPDKPEGYSFTVDIERQPKLARQVIQRWNQLATQLYKYVAHNVTFDMHMLANFKEPYLHENLSDSAFYIRFAHDNLVVRKGGPPLKLKDYAARYIDRSARDHDKLLQVERSIIAKSLNQKLRDRMVSCGRPPAHFKAASYTLGVLKEIFKDSLSDWTCLPTAETRSAYDDWITLDVPASIRHKVNGLIDVDMIPYNWCNRDNLKRYAHFDIVWVLELVEQATPVIDARDNWAGVHLEESLVLPLYEMERVGFAANKEYLLECQPKMKEYILKQRQTLFDLTGEEFTISQHKIILKILNNMGANLTSTVGEVLTKKHADLKHTEPDHPAIRVIELVQELRTLEKWYSTYLLRFLQDLSRTDRLYTTINSVGTVTGRVTSDFQQFPKGGIKTEDGEELFQPRKMVYPTGQDYPAIVYMDYSQIELRFQAFYTILVGHPDLNLCRAYMPFKCVNASGVLFDYNNPEHIRNWNGEWFLEEDPEVPWHPVDVHGATTEKATGLSPDDPAFKNARNTIGKRVNFAKNYGAQFQKIWTMFPELSEEEARRVDDAYYAAFPGVKEYHKYCYARADSYSYTQNLFGIKYYGVSGHNLINTLIQGGAAYYLKKKIRQLYDFSKQRGLKTRWQMQIHDELSWEWHKDDPLEVFFEFQRIMQDWPDTCIPIVAEMEVTTKSWAETKEVKTLGDLQVYLSA